ncbi:MAG: hypothetical protein QG642_455 [Patescibacteria group bacterium]|nr:hypothetical protein [Patescibacteria group bacterium]
MKKKIIFIVVIILAIIALLYFTISWYVKNKSANMAGELPADVKNISYTIDSQEFDLVNGKVELEYGLDLASKSIVTIFSEPVYGDLDADGDEDAAVLLVQESGGSGVFYYAALAIRNSDGSYDASSSLLLGDRIAPQTVEIRSGHAVYNFAERRPDEPMTTQASVAKSIFVQYDASTGRISESAKSTMLSEGAARLIAEQTCIKGGESLAPGMYNAGTKTWWFDANLNATREGCSPACVVSESTNTAEVNWRCTGLLNNNQNEQVACTMEAKECPDGSYVGRSGPNCEFAACPGAEQSASAVSEEIRKLFAAKSPNYQGSIQISIKEQTANHLRGGVTFVDEQSGGIFLATKVNAQWKIVFDGNGAIPCSLSSYNFPSSMLADCSNF